MGLGQGCGEVVAGPSEILLDQSDLTSELAGIPLGKPGALSIESGSSLGLLMLVGHGCELVRETLSVGLDSWTFFAQPHPLLRIISEGPVCLHESLVQLLALEVQVTGRSYHAQDHEGVPHESIRSASIEEVRELDEAQEVEGLGVGLEIEEVPDRRERSGMGHVQPGHGWDLVVGSVFQRTVELPDVPGLVRRGEHTLVQESHQDVGLLEVPVIVIGLA